MKLPWFYKLKRLWEHKIIVLVYHRVASPSCDPWQIATSPQHFEQHLDLLKRKFRVISLEQALEYIESGKIPANSICITFDDGYKDNYVMAKPLLEKYQVPATFFMATTYIKNQHHYWWDELQEIILSTPVLPATCNVQINDDHISFELGAEYLLKKDQAEEQSNWIWPDRPPTKRCELYLNLWEKLKPLNYKEIQTAITSLKEWAGTYAVLGKEHLPMTFREVEDLAKNPLFELGIHTATHPALSYHSKEIQEREIVECKNVLELISPRPVNKIAYPSGNYNEDTLLVVKELKLRLGFTTSAQRITKHSAPLYLGRFPVGNWNKQKFEQMISELHK